MFKEGNKVVITSPLAPSGKTYGREFTVGMTGTIHSNSRRGSYVISFDETPRALELVRLNLLHKDTEYGITTGYIYAESSLKHVSKRTFMESELLAMK